MKNKNRKLIPIAEITKKLGITIDMKKILIIGLLALLTMGGCIHPKDHGGGEPIVSPTNISTEVQDETDPVLPPYTPWWSFTE